MNTNGSYSCICASGWTGLNCSIGKETLILQCIYNMPHMHHSNYLSIYVRFSDMTAGNHAYIYQFQMRPFQSTYFPIGGNLFSKQICEYLCSRMKRISPLILNNNMYGFFPIAPGNFVRMSNSVVAFCLFIACDTKME